MTAGLAVTLVVAAICTGATQENAIIVNSKTGKRSNHKASPQGKLSPEVSEFGGQDDKVFRAYARSG
jgi:hypothetical protein